MANQLNDFLLYGALPQKKQDNKPQINFHVDESTKNIIDEAPTEITIKYIIENKPKTKYVREFLRINLASIKSEEELLFEEI